MRTDEDLINLVIFSKSLVETNRQDACGICGKPFEGFKGYINRYGELCKPCYDKNLEGKNGEAIHRR